MKKQQQPAYVALVGPWSLLLTVLLTWPLFGSGTLLLRDMVVPSSPALTDASLGLTEIAARALPQDALLAIAGQHIDAAMLARVLLWSAMVVGGVGAAYLARRLVGAGAIGQLAATTMVLWNPFVVERLLQGHWSVVLAATLLPALAYFISRRFYAAATATGTLCALTPTGAVLAIVVALVAARSWLIRLLTAIVGITVSLPWLVTTLTGPSNSHLTSADTTGVAAFAARAEHCVGTAGAVLGLGGIWNSEAVPASREAGFWGLSVLLLLALFAAGVWWLRQRARMVSAEGSDPAMHRVTATVRALLILAGIGVALPIFFAFPPGAHLLEWAVRTIPGAGLMRDTQKIVALALPGYVLLAAAGAEALTSWIIRGNARPATARPSTAKLATVPLWRSSAATLVALAAIILAVPDAPSAVAPLQPRETWPEWNIVTGMVAQDNSSLAVLPGGNYRIIDGQPVLDPAQKILPANVLTTGDLLVSGSKVPGEGSVAMEVEHALLAGDPNIVGMLADRGVGWVLLEKSPGPLGKSAEVLPHLDEVYTGENLTLYRVPGAIAAPQNPTRAGIYGALTLWLSVLGGSVMVALVALTRRQRPAPAHRPLLPQSAAN